MRFTLAVIFLVSAFAHAKADLFSSVDAFTKGVRDYNFSSDPYKFGYFLSIEEPQQPELTPKIVSPDKIDKVDILWKSKDHALVSVISSPKTESTPIKTALLVSLAYLGTGWAISDKIPFHAYGKSADISFEFTGGDHSPPPVVTVTTSNGGRGSSYRASATYEQIFDGRLIRKEP